MKKMNVLFVMALMGLLLFSAGGQANANVLKVATEAGFMPFEFVDEKTNELAGFDMDLIRALGEEMNMQVQISNVAWDGLFPGLLNRQFDVVIAGVTITEERAQTVGFSDPYFESVLTLVVRNDSPIQDLSDLAGKTAAVQISTTGDFVAEDIEGIGRIARFNTVSDAVQAVANRSADAAILDLPVAEAYLASNPNAPLEHLGAVDDSEYFGIVTRQQETELIDDINAALATLKANGTYDEIYNKWFGK